MKLVRLEVDKRVATVTLNRPDKKNAMNPPMHKEMFHLLDELAENKDVDVLILTGAGDSFTAGMDIVECFLDTYHDPEKFLSVNKLTMGWFKKLHYFPKPTIASVNGWCFGGGMAVLGVCDLALASNKAVFGFSEINFGLIPAGAAMWAPVYHMLPRQALYYILTGETISAQKALTLSLVNQVVEHSRLNETTQELASKLRKKNPHALRMAKELFHGLKGMDLSMAIPYEMAKVFELSYFERGEWVEQGIKQFKQSHYKPGLETYKRKETNKSREH